MKIIENVLKTTTNLEISGHSNNPIDDSIRPPLPNIGWIDGYAGLLYDGSPLGDKMFEHSNMWLLIDMYAIS